MTIFNSQNTNFMISSLKHLEEKFAKTAEEVKQNNFSKNLPYATGDHNEDLKPNEQVFLYKSGRKVKVSINDGKYTVLKEL